jgi:hypothetical protein
VFAFEPLKMLKVPPNSAGRVDEEEKSCHFWMMEAALLDDWSLYRYSEYTALEGTAWVLTVKAVMMPKDPPAPRMACEFNGH